MGIQRKWKVAKFSVLDDRNYQINCQTINELLFGTQNVKFPAIFLAFINVNNFSRY